MTHEEAIEILREERDWAQQLSYVNKALDMAKEALEKQIPKKPTEICEFAENDLVGICPFCNEGVYNEMDYCSNCGQKLEWGK